MIAQDLSRRFLRDESGVAIILLTLLLPVMIGFAVLAIDMSRVNNLHNDLQEAADALALAGAAELDGAPFALNRAKRAMSNLVQNQSLFSDAGLDTVSYDTADATSDVNVYFLNGIPANDTDELVVATYATSSDADARFVLVEVKPTRFSTIFPATYLDGNLNNTLDVSASAVAGFGSAVCDFTPLFICNPYEDTSQTGGVTLQEAAANTQYRRQQILMRSGGGNAAYSPGNFGFLTPPTGNGAKALAQAIASSQPNACYSSDGVTTKTGQQVGPILGGLNLRFGIKEPGTGSYNTADYGPAKNVRKGAEPTSGNACPGGNAIAYPDDPVAAGLMGLPPDPCFDAENCSLMGGRMGNGDWNLTSYWAINHGGSVPSDLWDGTAANLPTRYEVYRYELENADRDWVADVSEGGETGVPKSGCLPPVTDVDRRLIYGAILNCQALSDAGYNLGGHDEDLPVEAFASFFLTEPIKNNTDIYAELVDVTGRGGEGTLEDFARDEVQLYR